MRPISARFAWK